MDPSQTTLNPITWTSHFIRPYLPQISIAITSSILALFGSEINGWFKAIIRKRPFLIRVGAFVMLVAFGYGALNLFCAHLVSRILAQASDSLLAPVILAVFVIIGWLAEEKRQI